MTFNRGLFSSAHGDWETPDALFQALDAEFGFTLDACATAKTAKCSSYLSPDDDALSEYWNGVVFCNPPYGRRIGRWTSLGRLSAEKGIAEVVVMLLPARPDTRWWHEDVMKADEIRFIRGRLKFGGAKTGAPFPSCIVVFRGVFDG